MMRRVLFDLPEPIDDHPPAVVEGLWCSEHRDGGFVVDNIPFYAFGISLGDRIDAREDGNGALRFVRLIERGGHCTVRIVVFDASRVRSLRTELEQLGCRSEGSDVPTLIAVDIPPDADATAVRAWYGAYLAAGAIEVEESDVDWGTGAV